MSGPSRRAYTAPERMVDGTQAEASAPGAPEWPRRARGNALALGFGCALVVLVAEGVVRLVPPTNRFVTFSDASIDVTTPNGSFVYKGRNVGHISEFRVHRRNNSLGFADREHAIEKSPGMLRVLLLGDSQVEALQVPLELSYHKQLEARLLDEGRQVEVIALGRSGNGVAEALELYRDVGRAFAPDHVVWGFTDENDVVEASASLRAAIYRHQAQRLLRPPRLLRGSILASLFYSRQWRPGLEATELLAGSYEGLSGIGSLLHVMYLEEPPPLYREAAAIFERDVEALIEEILADGLPLTVISTAGAYPDFLADAHPDYEWRPRKLDELVERISESHGVRFVSMKPVFGDSVASGGEPIRFRGDGHLTVHAHGMVAAVLGAVLTESLPDASPPPPVTDG